VLELSRGQLLELNEELIRLKGVPTRVALRDMTIYPTNDNVWQELRKTREEVETRQRRTQWAQP
jgi:hypothetical protein